MDKVIKVVGAVFENQGKVLLAKRSEGQAMAGYWEFPGGKVELGESDQVALAREILEELSVKVVVGEFIGKNTHDNGEKKIELRAYWVEKISGDIVLNEHDEITWASESECRHLKIAPADIPFLQHIFTTLSQSKN